MRNAFDPIIRGAFLLLAATLLATPAWADKGGKGNKHAQERSDDRDDAQGKRGTQGRGRDDTQRQGGDGHGFAENDRGIVLTYYRNAALGGSCPPGLAKKHNGCLPPGQARRWSRGHPLPADLRYYDLPHDLVIRLSPPPAGHRYVQVAGDILLIAVGTSMVVDAIEDLTR